MSSLRIGIDLGGTKIEGIALAGSREVARTRVDTPRGDYTGTVDAIVALIGTLERAAGGPGRRSLGEGGPAHVGIGIPGTLSQDTGLVKNANSVWLIGRPLLADLERRLGREVRIANDANCFAVSEASDGAAAGADVVFGVIVGTGTGAGIVIRGRVHTGPNGIAGEWGHNPLPWPDEDERPGPECYCGRRGCVETFLSGPGLAADHAKAAGVSVRPEEIAAGAAAGDPESRATLARYERRMARALAAVINLLDPDVIVLGGGMSNLTRLYDAVPRLWGEWVFAAGSGGNIRTVLVPARHGDASGVRGAAWLWPDAV